MSRKTNEKPTSSTLGLRSCEKCGARDFVTLYTRDAPKNRIRRRKECRVCGHRITTYEAEER